MTDTATQASTDTAVRDYVRALLRQHRSNEDTRLAAIEAAEKAGHRIVDGGQTGQDTWEITDWRTGEVLASGDDGLNGYGEAANRLDSAGKLLHIDSLDTEYARVAPVGIPDSLADALEDWLGMAATTDEDVAQVAGWSVEEVARHREQA
ncbi:hypothetical protein ACWDCO_24510 [Streptomyces albogriseolus]